MTHEGMIFTGSATIRNCILVLLSIAAIAFLYLFGRPMVEVLGGGDGSATSPIHISILMCLISTMFFAWCFWMVVRAYAVSVSEAGVSGIAMRVRTVDGHSEWFSEIALRWEEIDSTQADGYQVRLSGHGRALHLNLLVFAEMAAVSELINLKTLLAKEAR